MTAAELLKRRAEVRTELEAGARHVLSVLREPESEMRSAPVGDVLCWTQGLDEAAVSRVLIAAGVNWGRCISLLSQREVALLCFQIKRRHPEVWDHWRDALQEQKVAA